MSVDPDDRTPLAIKNTGADIVTYGAPVLPGAMFMLAYYEGKKPIVGLPGCVMYAKRTIFDLVLPRLLAGEILNEENFHVRRGRTLFIMSGLYVPELWIWKRSVSDGRIYTF